MCDCIATANAKLAELNTVIDEGLLIDPKTGHVTPRIHIVVRKLHSKGRKPCVLVASFCPFCGEELPRVQ